jgi:hypothetical protein
MRNNLLWINLILLPITISVLALKTDNTSAPQPTAYVQPINPVVEPPAPIQSRLPNITETRPAFRQYPQIVEMLKKWEQEAPDFAETGTYGKTSTGQDQYFLRITNKNKKEDKPRALITGCIHGNEPISTWTIMWWVGSILSNYGKDSAITELVDTRDLYFIPVVCPDSYPNSRHSDGADPNRNFPSSGERQSITPIQNLKDFFKRMKFNAYISGHSFGRVWMFASNNDPQRRAAYNKLKGEISKLTAYSVTQLGGPGTTLDADWGNRQGAFSTIIEFGTHQRPPSDNDIQTEFDKTYKAALYFMKEAPVAFR